MNISEKFNPLFDIPEGVDTFIITGGRFSQKSFATSLSALTSCVNYGHRILYSRYTNASLKDSIYSEVEEKIELMNMQELFSLQQNRIESNFNKSIIVFKGLKAGSGVQTANLKGLKDFSMLILDEAEEMTDEAIYDKIVLSIRGNDASNPHKNIKVLILNPATKEHFIYMKYFESRGVQEGWNGIKDNVCYIHTSYLDCLEFVPSEILDYFEDMKTSNPVKYDHIVMGGWLSKQEGVVYTNWKFGEFNPDNLQVIYGQDYGFTDPTTLVAIAIDKKKKIIYAKEELYKSKITTSDIYAINRSVCGRNLIVGDSASAGTIAELQKLGLNIRGAKKGAGSIADGIALIQDYELVVHPESNNMAKELNNYVYTDKGAQLVCDLYNHILDALRYGVSHLLANRGKIEIR